MEKYEHLRLPPIAGNVDRQTRGGGGGYVSPPGRNKADFSAQSVQKADVIKSSFASLKNKISKNINPSFVFEIKINQSVSPDGFEDELARMGIHVLSVAENKRGYWVVFADDAELTQFKNKLTTYGQPDGSKYDFFNAIESFQDIPVDKKIGKALRDNPLSETADFIDIELWRMTDPQKNEQFITELKQAYTDWTQFRITDTLITKTFVLLRVKLTKNIFDEIIELKEISRADRPSITQFNPFEYISPDISDIQLNAPHEDAAGILIIDSGIISNHPMLEKCVGGAENFQTGEQENHDTVGHGTAVSGCAAYGDIEASLINKEFTPSNWIFSAKVMYAERNDYKGTVSAAYDPEKLIEHQFKDAVESFLSNPNYHIRVVNVSLGNSNEVWHKNYLRQLPLAALIDELAFIYPDVVFIVSTGNHHPGNTYETIAEIKDNYPTYLTKNPDFKIINPASAALALTVGSIAGEVRIEKERYGAEQIKTIIAEENQPSPFTRTGSGINGMIKPELVEYGGNLILSDNRGKISEDRGGKIAVINNKTTGDIIKFDYGTSFSAPKVAHLAGKIANQFPQRSGNFIKNMMLAGAGYPFSPNKDFYSAKDKKEAETKHLSICGFGLSDFERAVNSYSNRAVLWDEGQIGLNQIKVYSLQLPDIFFTEQGKKKIIVTLTFNPETRLTRGDSYLGNRMEFHLFHTINPQALIEKYGVISENTEQSGGVPEDLKKFEIDFFPGGNTRKAGCHQKAWKEYKKEPKNRPASPISLVLLNFNKWITDPNRSQDYCISVIFEHEKEIELYSQIRTNIQVRARI
ncbi:S8 family serine peptidase [Crenothrix polyspora]|uniref:Subtilisin-like serine protease n=1 Tax=Crenothrix polyspora TaxID=360316 RepID=A0A1R4HFY5_9GAMM|nr:S8 family serine peptidase [Crenothrix polyspora]SJM95158.1 Subtilisin-like serine protease [Crenothrix polyspora]